MEGEECGVRSPKSRSAVRSAKCEVRSAECGVRVRSAECLRLRGLKVASRNSHGMDERHGNQGLAAFEGIAGEIRRSSCEGAGITGSQILRGCGGRSCVAGTEHSGRLRSIWRCGVRALREHRVREPPRNANESAGRVEPFVHVANRIRSAVGNLRGGQSHNTRSSDHAQAKNRRPQTLEPHPKVARSTLSHGTVHPALRTPDFGLCTSHSALRTPDSGLRTSDSHALR